MQNCTDQSRHSATAIKIEGLQLSMEEVAAVERGLTIALTRARRGDHVGKGLGERLEPHRPSGGTANA